MWNWVSMVCLISGSNSLWYLYDAFVSTMSSSIYESGLAKNDMYAWAGLGMLRVKSIAPLINDSMLTWVTVSTVGWEMYLLKWYVEGRMVSEEEVASLSSTTNLPSTCKTCLFNEGVKSQNHHCLCIIVSLEISIYLQDVEVRRQNPEDSISSSSQLSLPSKLLFPLQQILSYKWGN